MARLSTAELRGTIVYSQFSGTPANLVVMDADGSNVRVLTQRANSEASGAVWSRDGARIAFFKRVVGSQIHVINADGTGEQQLTDFTSSNYDPTWSPDGTRIVFASEREGGRGQLYVMNADGSNQARLVTSSGFDLYPHWSPDGRKIAFVRVGGGSAQVWVVDADGSNEVQLTSEGNNSVPRWSPDSRRLVFASARDGGDYEIYVMNADGSNQVRLTHSIGEDNYPTWSPDGRYIAFSSDRDGLYRLFVMSADGSEVVRLTSGWVDYRADWYAAPPANLPPTIALGGPAAAVEGTDFVVTANVADAEHDALRVEFDIDGDGVFERVHEGITGASLSETVAFPDNGTRTVAARVSDGTNAAVTTTILVTIENDIPRIPLLTPATQSAVAGQDAHLTVSFEDKGPNDNPWAVKIVWGDGAESVVSAAAQDVPALVSHSYATAGEYGVVVTVTDKDGATSLPAAASVHVEPTPPPPLPFSPSCSATPDEIWPPTNRMVPVHVTIGGARVTGFLLRSVANNETGGADVSGWTLGAPDLDGSVRATRDGGGSGRTYSLSYEVFGDGGVSASCEVFIKVPHDKRQ